MKFKKALSIVLCIVLAVSCAFIADFSVLAANKGYVNGDGVRIRKEPKTSSTELGKVSFSYVTLNGKTTGQAVSGSNNIWYNITYNGITGYIYGQYITEVNVDAASANFTDTLNLFPASYAEGLKDIHAQYPNWKFIPEYLSVTIDEAVAKESGKKLISNSINPPDEWKRPDGATKLEPGYSYASDAAIKYYMRPEFYFDCSYVFAFMQQSYDSNTQNKEGLKSIVKNTFLDTEEYMGYVMNAAKDSGVSPYVIAAIIIAEQGTKGTSRLISGTVAEYEGYYNFFNYGASGETNDQIVTSGLIYAKNHGWNSKQKSITDGAVNYASGYVSKGQDNYYYTNFNVKGDKIGTHQYATSIHDTGNKASRLSKSFVGNYNSVTTFKIPVYKGEEIAGGTTPAPTPSAPAVTVKKGDANGDNTINALDLAAVKKHILSVAKLSGNNLIAADVNGDNSINALDIAAIKKHILGIQKIS